MIRINGKNTDDLVFWPFLFGRFAGMQILSSFYRIADIIKCTHDPSPDENTQLN